MNKILIIFLLTIAFVNAQSINDKKIKKENFYLEDQLYIGVTYNILNNLPQTIKQTGFSNGLFFGFIKDLPINKSRNIGFGLGLGYGMDTYFQNLKIFKDTNATFFENFDEDEAFKNNKLVLHSIESPLEFRLRTSTKTDYKFWRLYAGVKFKYIFYSKSQYKNDGTKKIKNIKNVANFNYGLTLSGGNSTWNIHFYYGIKPILKDAYFNNSKLIKTRDFKIGLIFYIL